MYIGSIRGIGEFGRKFCIFGSLHEMFYFWKLMPRYSYRNRPYIRQCYWQDSRVAEGKILERLSLLQQDACESSR